MISCLIHAFVNQDIQIPNFIQNVSLSHVLKLLIVFQVPENSFISSVPIVDGYYRIVGPNGAELFPGVPCVDIAQEDLFRYDRLSHTTLTFHLKKLKFIIKMN